jgi:hypothetical protein
VKWFFHTFVNSIAGLIGIYSATCGGAWWVASNRDLSTLGTHEWWWWQFVTLGILVPTTLLSVLCLFFTERERKIPEAEPIPESNSSEQTKSTSDVPARQIAAVLAKHLLDGCLDDIRYLSIELLHERGKAYSTAKAQQQGVIQAYTQLCHQRYRRDKSLLEAIGNSQAEDVNHTYVQLKASVFATCEEVEELLSRKCTPDEARTLIRQAADKFRRCASDLEKGIENYAWNK